MLFLTTKNPEIQKLSGKALRLALEKPKAWEYRLFAQILIDEISQKADLRQEQLLEIALGAGEQIELENTLSWIMSRIAEVTRMSNLIQELFNSKTEDAFGPPGVPGNVGKIGFVAKKIATVYLHAIEWSLRIKRAHIHECFQPVALELSAFTNDMIEQVENFGPMISTKIEWH